LPILASISIISIIQYIILKSINVLIFGNSCGISDLLILNEILNNSKVRKFGLSIINGSWRFLKISSLIINELRQFFHLRLIKLKCGR